MQSILFASACSEDWYTDFSVLAPFWVKVYRLSKYYKRF